MHHKLKKKTLNLSLPCFSVKFICNVLFLGIIHIVCKPIASLLGGHCNLKVALQFNFLDNIFIRKLLFVIYLSILPNSDQIIWQKYVGLQKLLTKKNSKFTPFPFVKFAMNSLPKLYKGPEI